MACVYEHIRLDTGDVFYVGIGTYLKRAYDKHSGRSTLWKNIANKSDYLVKIVYENITRDEALAIEVELIRKYGRIDLGTGTLANHTDGGDVGGFHWKGKKLSEEHRKKLRDAVKYKAKRTKESYEQGASKIKGVPKSEEHRRKLSNAIKGKSPGPWTLENREKHRRYWFSVEDPISQYDSDGNFIRNWYNRLIASECLGLTKEQIRTSFRRGNMVMGKFFFKRGYDLNGDIPTCPIEGEILSSFFGHYG